MTDPVTAHPIDTEALRRLADQATPGPWPLLSGGEYVGGVGLLVAPDDGGVSPANAAFIAAARTAIPALLDALAAAEHRATQAEAQADIRGRAVVIYRDRVREAEAERDYRRRENAELYDELVATQEYGAKLTHGKDAADARIKAVRDALDTHAYTGIYTGQERVAVSDIRRALEGDT